MKSFINRLHQYLKNEQQIRNYMKVFIKYKDYTMIPIPRYLDNLTIAADFKHINGDIVECGVWRGGMSAGVAEVVGVSKTYHLFDSFEGLPKPSENDGFQAFEYQEKKDSPHYFNNCAAEENFAQAAMDRTRCKYLLHKGWFHETTSKVKFDNGISILRLDGDWYDSTMICLQNLFNQVNTGGVVIIDDYFNWDGCTKAVHDFLSSISLPYRIRTTKSGVAFIIKDI